MGFEPRTLTAHSGLILVPPLLGQVRSARCAKRPKKREQSFSGNASFFHAHLEPGSGAQRWPQPSAILQEPVAVTHLGKSKDVYELEYGGRLQAAL